MSKGSEVQNNDPLVYLGYIEDGDKIEGELKRVFDSEASSSKSADGDLSPPWLVNKLGGTPIFPCAGVDPDELSSILDSIKCRACKNSCVLVFQINSPVDESPLDRVMQLYCCIKSDCSKHSWFALRCMLDSSLSNENFKPPTDIESKEFELHQDPVFGPVYVCKERAFFVPYYVSVIEEPTGKEDFTRNNLEALKLASKFNDPDLKPAPIEEKYKNLKNYKAPQPPAHLSDLEDFEKFQLEKLYGNDKDMYRYYKRLRRYQSQVVRYDWEGKPLVNSTKIKIDILPCSSCSAKRKFEFQLMSPAINFLQKEGSEFDRDTLDFSSIIVHSCMKNCSTSRFTLEDTYFMPDPDSRIFNKVKQRMLSMKLADKEIQETDEKLIEGADEKSIQAQVTSQPSRTSSSKSKKRKKKSKNKK